MIVSIVSTSKYNCTKYIQAYNKNNKVQLVQTNFLQNWGGDLDSGVQSKLKNSYIYNVVNVYNCKIFVKK